MAQQNPGEAQRSVSSKLSKRLSKSSRKTREGSASQTSLAVQGPKARELEKDLPPVPSVPPQHLWHDTTENTPAEDAVSASGRPPLAELHNESILRPFAEGLQSASLTSLGPENLTVQGVDMLPPTLRPKRTTTATADMPRKKSSKRKSNNREREQEIKAMSGPSSPIPIPRRPQSYTSGIMTRDSKKFHGGLNRHLDRPTSEISLPKPESVRTSVSGMSDWPQNFKVSAFDALSPRPTIKYMESPRHMGSRNSMRKNKGPAIPEESFNTRARMDALADDLDAKGLRELMDRDQRRRDRKQRRDTEKLKRKLEQRNIETEKVRQVPAAAHDAEMHDDGLELQKTPSADRTRRTSGELSRENAQSPSSWLQDPSQEVLPASPHDPFHDPHSESRYDAGTPSERGSEKDLPIIETAKAVRLSSASMSPPLSPESKHARGPSNLSNFITAPPDASEDPEPPQAVAELEAGPEEALAPLPTAEERRDSDSSRRNPNTWTSFFRRSRTKKEPSERHVPTPTSFSNTSRESFARSAVSKSPPPPVVQRSFKRPSSGTPTRTQSRFREDLPELPASPEPSRIQSPDPTLASSPYIDHASKVETLDDEARVTTPLGDVHPVFRDEIATSRSRGHSFRSASPTEQPPSAMLLSQSLASVDSEGSWLSGRPAKRSSVPISSLRESQASLVGTVKESEGTSPVDEATFRRQEPPRHTPAGPSGLTSQLKNVRERPAASPNASADTKVGSTAGTSSAVTMAPSATEHSLRYDTVPGFHASPQVSPPMALPAHAQAGMQGEIASTSAPASPGPDAEELDSPVSPVSPESPDSPSAGGGARIAERVRAATVQRATSVDYGRGSGHARQVSAGSARLLDIPARTPSEAKRASFGPEMERERSTPGAEAGSAAESAGSWHEEAAPAEARSEGGAQ